jgi:hypothetical protein
MARRIGLRNNGLRIVIACVLAACGAGDSGGSSSGPGGGPFDAGSEPDRNMVTPGEICDRLATIQCAGEQHCCSNPGRDFAACQSTASKRCTNNLKLDAVAMNPITGFDAAAASMAFEELEQRASTCDPKVAEWAVSAAGFVGAFRGTLAEGAACTPAGAASFNPNDPAQLAALASCQDSANVVCLPSLGVWTCTRRAPLDGSCVFDGNCQDGLYCADSGFVTDQCKERLPVGAECSTANQCASFICKSAKCASPTAPNAYCLAELQ